MMKRIVLLLVMAGILQGHSQDSPISLPGTSHLSWEEEDLSERLMDGAHTFVERKITESRQGRAQHWSYDFSSEEAYEASIGSNRERFRKIIGAVDQRIGPVAMERFGDEFNPALVTETLDLRIFQVRWPVLEGVWSEGLLVESTKNRKGTILLIPDADETPEQLIGLAGGDPLRRKMARHLVHTGYRLVIPTLINREIYLGEDGKDSRLARSNQSHREWIYRQAFHIGRHIIGYEVQKVLAAVDWSKRSQPQEPVYVSGYGEGGLIAFYAAACDTRIQAAHVAGYFQSREKAWSEPIERNVFGLLNEFGDAQISSLIPPRAFLVDPVAMPKVSGPKGEIRDTPLSKEFESFGANLASEKNGPPIASSRKWSFPFANRAKSSIAPEMLHRFFDNPVKTVKAPETTTNDISPQISDQLYQDQRTEFDPAKRHHRLFKQLEGHVQELVSNSNAVREEFYLYQAEPELRPGKWSTSVTHPTLDPAEFVENSEAFRTKFHEEAMGKFDEPLLPLNPRSRKIAETESWTAWDVVLDVYPELFAWGALVLPKNLEPGEKRPVVVCQHGRNGLPRDSIDAAKTAYSDFAAKLAERGFITFCPHNLYRGEDRYRWLDRKANNVGCSLFSFIIPSHRQILNWLKAHPNVDPDRIAFYGLSYGGETAVRVPPVLKDYAVVICSGDFNQWTRKIAATNYPRGFMRSIEWEMPYWNLGHTFDYAEMAYLIFPRPFMVERGHHDLVAPDHWVAHEYAKVRWLYAQFGMSDRTRIEYFQGGHSIRGKGTFEFLHQHLDWPAPGSN